MNIEEQYSSQPLEAGVDEVGRGPLAGPVSAAAVILDPESKIEGLKDSEDWRNRCLVRHKLRTLNDSEISNWLDEVKKDKSEEYSSEIRKVLREEWAFIKEASRLRHL